VRGASLRARLPVGPLAEREFRLLLTGEVISLSGSALAPIALAFAVFDLTGSASDLGLVLAASWLPQVVFVLVGGVVADRLPRSLILVGANVVSGGAQAVVAALLITGNAELWHLLVTQVARGSATAFFFPAIQAVVPDTVRPSLLQQANAAIRLSFSATTIVGAAVGGGVVAAAGPGWAFAFDAGTYFASAVVLSRMRRRGTIAIEERNLFRELREGWNEFRARTWVVVVVVASGFMNLVWTGASGVLAPLVARESLGGPGAFGAIIAAEAVGLLVGGLIALRYRPGRPLVVGLLTGLGMPLFLAALALPAPLPLVLLAALPAGVGLELFNVFWITTMQQHIPPERLARVTSYDALGSFVFIPVGYTLAGPAAEGFGLSETLWAATAVTAALTVLSLGSADVRNLRRRDQAGEGAAEDRAMAV
jgi:MFS family permease